MKQETPTRRRSVFPVSQKDPESQQTEQSMPTSSNNRSKESVLALTIVVLLFVVSIVIMGYAYGNERSLRFELEQENGMNIEVIRACDRMQLRQKHLEMELMHHAVGAAAADHHAQTNSDNENSNNKEIGSEVALNCPHCTDCAKAQELADKLAEEAEHASLLESLENWSGVEAELSGVAVERLKEGLQHASREVLQLQYGPPPYFVEIELLVPGAAGHSFDEPGRGGSATGAAVLPAAASVVAAHGGAPGVTYNAGVILLQLAPLDEMPYASLYFMTHVANGAYDGCLMSIVAGHLVAMELSGRKCNPDMFNIGSGAASLSAAKTLVTKKLAFQEYSADFPHKQYTVGFSRRPGGPSFYINMQDNTAFHGPSGQKEVEYPEEADTCFATVTAGVDVLHHIAKLPTSAPGSMKLKQPAIIRSMRIVAG